MAQVERIQKEVYTCNVFSYIHPLYWKLHFQYICMQIAQSAPLVGEREDLSSLAKEYAEDDTIYQSKIQVSIRTCIEEFVDRFVV